MHLYALGNNEEVIYAGHANKHVNYTCLECAQIVRLRSGSHRQPHFYHLQPNHKCRLNGKSMPHLMLQHHLESILPKGEVQLECRFPLINRIADVAWHAHKIIFEVQCSPISAAEILQRNADYASQGYQVIWLLHQSRYNQYRVTAAEGVLENFPHYFTNMDGEGKGEIFDQPSFIEQGVRKHRLAKTLINLPRPFPVDQSTQSDLPHIIKKRLETWQLFFQGDYLCLCQDPINQKIIDGIKEAELQWHPKNYTQDMGDLSLYEFIKKIIVKVFVFPYRSILRVLLERACR